MIFYENKDLFESLEKIPNKIIVHGVNCQGAMRSGFAKELRQKDEEIYNSYKKFCEDSAGNTTDTLLGKIDLLYSRELKCYVGNCFTQNYYGRNGNKFVSYDAIDECMRKLAIKARDLNILMPKIGSGLGGGNWQVIESIINYRLAEQNVFIYSKD